MSGASGVPGMSAISGVAGLPIMSGVPGVFALPGVPLGGPRKLDSPKKNGKASGWVPAIRPKHRRSLPNGRQQGGAIGAAPKGRRFASPPIGVLPFGKDFRCFGLISGAHPEAFPPPFVLTVHLPWFSQRFVGSCADRRFTWFGKWWPKSFCVANLEPHLLACFE